VATVDHEDAARPVVERLLLAGLGPAVRLTPQGAVEVTVVAGQGQRAREALDVTRLGDEFADPAAHRRSADLSDTTDHEGDDLGGSAGDGHDLGAEAGAWGRAVRHAAMSVPDEEVDPRARWGVARTIVLLGLAMILIPALAFYISYKAAGG